MSGDHLQIPVVAAAPSNQEYRTVNPGTGGLTHVCVADQIEDVVEKSAERWKVEMKDPHVRPLSGMTCAQYAPAWRNLAADEERGEATAETFANSATANICAQATANPETPDWIKLKRHP